MTQWYYVQGSTRIGPIEEDLFRELVKNRTITPRTLVWHKGMTDWRPWLIAEGELPPSIPSAAPVNDTATDNRDSSIPLSPGSIPQPHATASAAAVVRYGGFWRRFAADVIDALIVGIANAIINTALGVGALNSEWWSGETPAAIALLNLSLGIVYNIWFVGSKGATPGKLAMGMRIIRADGGRVSYGLAAGRYFAEWLSALTLLFGYLMVVFDEEKRALHDRICNTRVVRTR